MKEYLDATAARQVRAALDNQISSTISGLVTQATLQIAEKISTQITAIESRFNRLDEDVIMKASGAGDGNYNDPDDGDDEGMNPSTSRRKGKGKAKETGKRKELVALNVSITGSRKP